MAVKARTEITLSAVRDVQATYRYYLLQSSTLSAPTKPTAQPPGGSWDDTEPSYTSGSTNSLYLVDCTVFSDGTFSYSEVSLSSSYEAAKAAYNKAQAAQDTAESAQDAADAAQETADSVETKLTDQATTLTKTCDQMILSALESYTTTSDLEKQLDTLSAQLSVLSDNIQISITQTNETITSVQGDLQDQIKEISSNFDFSVDGFTISSSEAQTMVQMTAGKFSILDGGMEVTYVSNKCLYVTNGYFLESLRVDSFALVRRSSTGNLSFIKVGD
jgi:uncharacterized phage infection (PIP) family protein YhgE